MKDINLRDGKRILLLEQKDLDRTMGIAHDQNVRQLVGVSRAYFDIVLVNVSSRNGPQVLPKWLREMRFRPMDGPGGSYWILEKDEEERFV